MKSKEIEEAEEKYPLANAKLSAETQNGNCQAFLYGSRMQRAKGLGV